MAIMGNYRLVCTHHARNCTLWGRLRRRAPGFASPACLDRERNSCKTLAAKPNLLPCPSFSVPGFSQVFVLNSGDSERHLGDDVFILGKNRKRVDASSDPWGGGGARARVDITTQQKRTHTTDDTHARLNPAERGLRRLSACRLGPKSNQKRHVGMHLRGRGKKGRA